jgi:hypothetical protein
VRWILAEAKKRSDGASRLGSSVLDNALILHFAPDDTFFGFGTVLTTTEICRLRFQWVPGKCSLQNRETTCSILVVKSDQIE